MCRLPQTTRVVLFASLIAIALPACDETAAPDAAGADAGDPRSCEGKKAGAGCGDGTCVPRTDSRTLECFTECTAEGQICAGTGVCGECKADGESRFSCVATTTQHESGGCRYKDACGFVHESCPPGAQCLDNGGMFCWTVCSDDTDCAESAVCTDTELGFSVCVEDAE